MGKVKFINPPSAEERREERGREQRFTEEPDVLQGILSVLLCRGLLKILAGVGVYWFYSHFKDKKSESQ